MVLGLRARGMKRKRRENRKRKCDVPKINFDCPTNDCLSVNLIFTLVISKNVAKLGKGVMVAVVFSTCMINALDDDSGIGCGL